MKLSFGLIVVFVLVDSSEMAPSYDSSEAEDASHYNTGFASSAVAIDDYPPIKLRKYAEFHTSAPVAEEVKIPSTSSNKLSSRVYAEFHTQRTEAEEVEPTFAITNSAYKSTSGPSENLHTRDKEPVENYPNSHHENAKQNDITLPAVIQRTTRDFLDAIATHDLIKPTVERKFDFSSSNPKNTRSKGILDVLMPPSRLESIKEVVDYFRGILSSTF